MVVPEKKKAGRTRASDEVLLYPVITFAFRMNRLGCVAAW